MPNKQIILSVELEEAVLSLCATPLGAQRIMGNWPLWVLLCALNMQENLSNTALNNTLNTTLDATLGHCGGGCSMDESAAVELDHNRLAGMPPSCLQGQNMSPQRPVQVIPKESVVRVGSTVSFCCIVGQGNVMSSITYDNQIITATRISSQIYAIILPNVTATSGSGNDVVCIDSRNKHNGATLFAGFPPDDQGLVCETDLVTVTCHWNRGRVTELYGDRRTVYALNNRSCSEASESENLLNWCELSDPVTLGEGNWTLNATNPLGNVVLTDRADLGHRVHLQAPEKVASLQVHAGNASVGWSWKVEKTRTLPLLCQVQLKHNNLTETRNYTGQGLSEVLLTGLHPDGNYSLQVRCGTELNFWKWSDLSSALNFQTKEARPDALDVWICRSSNLSALIMWKPLSANQSHGQIQGYEVTWDSPSGSQHSRISPENHSFLLRDLGDGIATVTAFNSAGSSPPSRIGCPRLSGGAVPVSQILGSRSGFDLSWPASTSATCGYVVEWSPAHKGCDLIVDWVKLPPQPNQVRLPPDECQNSPEHFAAGLKYSLSVYSCSQGAPELLVRMEGYAEELVPDQRVQNLKVEQIGSSVVLQWDEVPQEGRRGFIRGYSVSRSAASGQVTTENISGAGVRNHTFFGLPPESLEFTVKAFTSAGEGPGATAAINLSPTADWLMWVTPVSLVSIACFLILTAVIYFRKRTWCIRMMEKLYRLFQSRSSRRIGQHHLRCSWRRTAMTGWK
ncbi:hypothetical protein GJAV_G00049930 [Gymnothorax javanicus]|nr:hypothetical protein GJAV_G00049930 [Gymnothorax javanicus]